MMPVLKCSAKIECDGCGTIFEVVLDTAARFENRPWDLMTLIEHSLGNPDGGFLGRKMLCDMCVQHVCDAIPDDDPQANPSPEEVEAILNKAHGV